MAGKENTENMNLERRVGMSKKDVEQNRHKHNLQRRSKHGRGNREEERNSAEKETR